MRSFLSSAQGRSQRRRRGPFCPRLEALEDRTVPTFVGWAIQADPEGYVFVDDNGNSTFDAGESAMGAGLTVYVDANNNSTFDVGETNTTTDATGHYSIILPDGTYTIRVVPQTGFQTDAVPFGTLVHDFGSIENGINADGSHNYSGLAWANGSLYVTFVRTDSADNVMYQADPQTGAALGPAVSIPGRIGEITFDGTDFWGADYRDDFIIRFNFAGQELQRLSFPGIDINSVESDGAALRVLDHDAKRIYQIDPSGSGTILGYVNAPNDNVIGLAFDGASLYVNGTNNDLVYALDPATGAVQRSFAAHGDFAYGLAVHGTDLWLSDNRVSGVFQFDLGFGGGRIVTIEGVDVSGVDLAVFQPASISGRAFSDNNQNGVQDANDGGLAGWRVYSDSNGNGKPDGWEASVVTNALGDYAISGVRPGPYTVVLDLAGQRLTRWSSVTPSGGVHSLAPISGEAITTANFANFLDRSAPLPNEWGTFEGGRMNLYTGLVWADVVRITGSGMTYSYATGYVANSTEGGFDDWRMPSKAEAQAVAATGYGAQFGYDPGVNTLWWTSTAANGQKQWSVNLNNGSTYAAGINGILATTMLRDSGIVIDDGGAGYSATGFSSKSTSGAYLGDQSTASSGTGSKTATWTFGGLEVGATYKVAATWKTANGAASNSPFKVIDGASTVATVAVNQQSSPSDFSIADTSWRGLGTFTLTSNTLKVQLSNLANGTVLADAVRIFKVFPSYAPPAPLMAADLPSHAPATATITSADVKLILNEAIRRWRKAGVNTSNLGNIDVRISDLGGSMLGLASGHTITLDDNSAGWGWFVDRTPRSDSEFTTPGNQGEQGRMDLLSVLMHEVGHLLGHGHDAAGLMGETLGTGVRENPEPGNLGAPPVLLMGRTKDPDQLSLWWGVDLRRY